MSKTKNGWKKIGDVCIDSASLILADPFTANFEYSKEQIFNMGNSYKQHLNIDHPENEGEIDHDMAIMVKTGLGDGFYPVYAKYEDLGPLGKRIAEVKVVFLPHPIFG